MYYLSNETGCLIIDLRNESLENRAKYEEILENYQYLDIESYEDNLYHVYVKTEGDWESAKELSVELDDVYFS